MFYAPRAMLICAFQGSDVLVNNVSRLFVDIAHPIDLAPRCFPEALLSNQIICIRLRSSKDYFKRPESGVGILGRVIRV